MESCPVNSHSRGWLLCLLLLPADMLMRPCTCAQERWKLGWRCSPFSSFRLRCRLWSAISCCLGDRSGRYLQEDYTCGGQLGGSARRHRSFRSPPRAQTQPWHLCAIVCTDLEPPDTPNSPGALEALQRHSRVRRAMRMKTDLRPNLPIAGLLRSELAPQAWIRTKIVVMGIYSDEDRCHRHDAPRRSRLRHSQSSSRSGLRQRQHCCDA